MLVNSPQKKATDIFLALRLYNYFNILHRLCRLFYNSEGRKGVLSLGMLMDKIPYWYPIRFGNGIALRRLHAIPRQYCTAVPPW